MSGDLLVETPQGLYCPAGGFYIDPHAPVARAIITHAHADHAFPGSTQYICSLPCLPVLQHRMGPQAKADGIPFRQAFDLERVRVSLHPSGHVLGGSQIRIESSGQVWVVSGDYKRAPDPTCEPFELLRCDVFVTEATFALPIFHWAPPEAVVREMFDWWEHNRNAGRTSVLFCYALGKAQRILAELLRFTDRPVYVHGAIENLTQLYRAAGVSMLSTIPVAEAPRGQKFKGELILAPKLARGQTWMRRFGEREEAFVSGWMRIRGTRRRMAYDRGFVLSDHADWPALVETIRQTGAQRVIATHGYSEVLARYFAEEGLQTRVLRTSWVGEGDAE